MEREGVVSKKVSSASWPAVARASRRLPRELRETHAPLSSRKQPRRRGRTRGPPRMECVWTVTCRTPPPASWAVPMAAEPIVGHRGPCVTSVTRDSVTPPGGVVRACRTRTGADGLCFGIRRISFPPLRISYYFGNGSRATRGTLRVGTPGPRGARPGTRQGERARAPLTCLTIHKQ